MKLNNEDEIARLHEIISMLEEVTAKNELIGTLKAQIRHWKNITQNF